jgi:hypothetical protein
MAERKPTAIVGLKVRLREPLRKKLEVAAKKKGVSLNAELVARLEESFLGEGLMDRIDKILASLNKRIAHLVALQEDLKNAITRSEDKI